MPARNRPVHERVLIFDWDGTLFDSMPIKHRTFSDVVSSSLNIPADAALAIYQAHSGRPRREIFQEAARAHGRRLSDADMDAMSQALTRRNEEALADAALFEDAAALLDALSGNRYALYISSSVPENELKTLVKRAVPAAFQGQLRGVFGSKPGFSKGPEHVAHICMLEACGPADCHMFGDDEADMRLSEAAGIASSLVDRSGLRQNAPWPVVRSLKEVITWL